MKCKGTVTVHPAALSPREKGRSCESSLLGRGKKITVLSLWGQNPSHSIKNCRNKPGMSMKTKDTRFHGAQFGKGTLGVRQRSLRSCRLRFRHDTPPAVTKSIMPAAVLKIVGTNRECL